MKKLYRIGLSVITIALVNLYVAPTQAATDTTSAQSTATIQFEQGGGLYLRAVPNFDFGVRSAYNLDGFMLQRNSDGTDNGKPSYQIPMLVTSTPVDSTTQLSTDVADDPTNQNITNYLDSYGNEAYQQDGDWQSQSLRALIVTATMGSTVNHWSVSMTPPAKYTRSFRTLDKKQITSDEAAADAAGVLTSDNIYLQNQTAGKGSLTDQVIKNIPAPTSEGITPGSTPTAPDSVHVPTSGTPVLQANASDNSLGNWALDFGEKQSVNLYMPADAYTVGAPNYSQLGIKPGQAYALFTGTITWTLNNGASAVYSS